MLIKKILSIKKSPIRLIYEDLYGTTIGPKDEVSYIVSCLRETLNIVGSHYIKNFPRKKMSYRLIARDRIFCEGTLAECQAALTGISNMISAGFSTSFQVEEFIIVIDNEKE